VRSIVPSKSTNAPKRTPRRKQGQALATLIRDAIVSGEYAIGDSLGQESQLLERFGVSRPTLRETCRILEAESLIQVERGTSGGIRVRRPDRGVLSRYASLLLQYQQTTLRDVYEYRMLVEPAVARWLATERSEEAGTELLNLAEKVESEETHRGQALLAARFHSRLVELSGNRTLSFLTGLVEDVLAPSIYAGLDRARDATAASRAVDRAVRSQRKIAHLIAERRGGDAAIALTRDLEGARDTLLRSLGANAIVDSRVVHRPGHAPKVADAVAEHFRSQIATGALREGDVLPPVSELQREIQVSRPSLVEGLRILESQGLIETRLGASGGAIVHAPTISKAVHYASLVLACDEPTPLADLLWAEQILEPPAVRLLVERATDEDRAALGQAAERVRTEPDSAHGRGAAEFRRTLLGLSKNATLGVVASLVSGLIRAGHEAMYTMPFDVRRGDQTLNTLVSLVDLGQAEAAEVFWRNHLEQMARSVEQQGADFRPLRPFLDDDR
jgi:GntR family transcriptional repressor for pyruvate dehydrogenase complex